MLPERKMTCPHCLAENPAFGPQRCEHCGMNMISDQFQAIREQKIKPLAEKLDEQLLFIRAGKDQAAAVSYARELYNGLVIYEKHTELAFIKPLLAEAQEALAPFPERPKANPQVFMNYIVFALLFLFPVISFMMYENLVVLILLTLPLIGWFVIAILPMLKQKKN